MAKIAVLNDSPEIVALVSQALSPGGHTFMKMVEPSAYMARRTVEFEPDLVVIPMHRRLESIDRPLTSYHDDVQGTEALELISAQPELAHVPIVLLGFYTNADDMPEDYRHKVRYTAFLTFPVGLQELNPLITGLVGSGQGRSGPGEQADRNGRHGS